MYKNSHKYAHQGNALFLILIAVALFAALSYAITQSGRGGGNVNKETTLLASSNLMQYMQNIKTGVDRLKVLGCAPAEISFELPDGSYNNTNAPTNNTCHVFHTSGAGLSYQAPDPTILNSALSAEAGYGDASFERNNNIDMGDTSSAYAVELTIPFVSDEICLAINKELHDISTIPENTSDTPIRIGFTGNFTSGGYIPCENSDLASNACGTHVGCFRVAGVWGGSQATNIVYQYLLAESP